MVNLKILTIREVYKESDVQELLPHINQMTGLEVLDLDLGGGSALYTDCLANLTKLKSFTLFESFNRDDDEEIIDFGVKNLTNMTKLHLGISSWKYPPDHLLLTNLMDLEYKCGPHQSLCEIIEHLTNLTKLDWSFSYDKDFERHDDLLNLSNLKKLEDFRCDFDLLTPKVFPALGFLKSLTLEEGSLHGEVHCFETFPLTSLTKLDFTPGGSIEFLSQLTHLRDLLMDGNQMRESYCSLDPLTTLTNLQSLTCLNFGGTLLDPNLLAIGKLKSSLLSLELGLLEDTPMNPRSKQLDFEENLTQLTGLTQLTLTQTWQLTEKALDSISMLTRLQSLIIEECKWFNNYREYKGDFIDLDDEEGESQINHSGEAVEEGHSSRSPGSPESSSSESPSWEGREVEPEDQSSEGLDGTTDDEEASLQGHPIYGTMNLADILFPRERGSISRKTAAQILSPLLKLERLGSLVIRVYDGRTESMCLRGMIRQFWSDWAEQYKK